MPVSLEHLRHVDPTTRIVIGYRLDVTPAESPRLRRRLALAPDPRTTLHIDEVVFPDTPGRFWGAMRFSRSLRLGAWRANSLARLAVRPFSCSFISAIAYPGEIQLPSIAPGQYGRGMC